MSRTWTFSMEMWDRTKSSLARVSQLADIQDKPENEDIEFDYLTYFIVNIFKISNIGFVVKTVKTIRENKANSVI